MLVYSKRHKEFIGACEVRDSGRCFNVVLRSFNGSYTTLVYRFLQFYFPFADVNKIVIEAKGYQDAKLLPGFRAFAHGATPDDAIFRVGLR